MISVVGRYLEHSRIYRFGVGDEEKMYIASADFMTRNTVRRVEVAAPVYDPAIRERIRYIFDTIMKDDEKGKEQLAAVKDMRANGLVPLGNWHSHPESPSRPSEEDKRLAYDSTASYMILSLMDNENPVLNSFHIEGTESEKEELVLV